MLCYKVIRYFFMMPNKAHLHYSPQVKESIINRDICASEIRGSVLVEHLPEIDDLRDRVRQALGYENVGQERGAEFNERLDVLEKKIVTSERILEMIDGMSDKIMEKCGIFRLAHYRSFSVDFPIDCTKDLIKRYERLYSETALYLRDQLKIILELQEEAEQSEIRESEVGQMTC